MSFAKVFSAQTYFLKGQLVTVEVDISHGLNSFSIVGLGDKAVEESRDRVSAAIKNSGFASPKSKNHKVVVSLAPAHFKKEGPAFDVAIALAYLRASEDILFEPEKRLFLGELSLDGHLRGIGGTLALALTARNNGFTELFIPRANAREAALVEGISVFGADTLADIIAHINTKETESRTRRERLTIQPHTKVEIQGDREVEIDFSDIRGQAMAKRCLSIAAAGGHNVALCGPAGTGKTMLARAFPSILPSLSFEEILETTAIHSIAGELAQTLVTTPPFRSPHHTCSYAAMVGGGSMPRPGEITLAHRGVLFLDEFPEFDTRVIEALRQPLEDRVISVARSKATARYPARFTLVAALNPCPCGNFGSTEPCSCSPLQLLRYQRKLSGPIIDRIDLWITVPKIHHGTLMEKRNDTGESEPIRAQVERARRAQYTRFGKEKINSEMSTRDIERFIPLTPDIKNIFANPSGNVHLSARGFHRVLKVSRTIADLEESEQVNENHILEALQYRPKKVRG